MKLYSDEGLYLHDFETLYLSNPGIATYCQRVSLSQTIHRTYFFVQKIQLSLIKILTDINKCLTNPAN